jgi:hypothetical protein
LFSLADKKEAEAQLKEAGKGQEFSDLEVEVWQYIVNNKAKDIRRGSTQVSWDKFAQQWTRTAAIVYLLDKTERKSNVIPLRSAKQLEQRQKDLNKK